jgi:hypothetical protein
LASLDKFDLEMQELSPSPSSSSYVDAAPSP